MWRKAARLLVRGKSVAEVAAEVHRDRRTVQRWLKRAEFQVVLQEELEKWDQELSEAKALAHRHFQELIGEAVGAYKALVSDDDHPNVRRQAAADILKTAGILTSAVDEGAADKIREIRETIIAVWGEGAARPREVSLELDAAPDAEGVPRGLPPRQSGGVRKKVGKERGAGE